MNQRILHLIWFLLLLSCSSNKNDKSKQTPQVSFEEYLKAIPTHQLPIELSCGLPDGSAFTDEYSQFKQFIPSTMDRIYGRIETTSAYQLILYGQTGDDIAPRLYIYDHKGNVMDSLSLMLKGCGSASDKSIPHSQAYINQDLSIHLIDTTQYIHSLNNSTYAVDSIAIAREDHQINSKGELERGFFHLFVYEPKESKKEK